MLLSGEERLVLVEAFGRVLDRGGGSSTVVSRACGHAGSGAGHPFAARGGMELMRPQPGGLNHRRDLAAERGSSRVPSARRRLRSNRASCRRLTFEAADVAVAETVEDQGEELAGGGDRGDVAAASGGDAVTVDA